MLILWMFRRNKKELFLKSMTGDVANATKEEAEIWLKSLGEQRNASQTHAAKMKEEQKKMVEKIGDITLMVNLLRSILKNGIK